MRKSMEITESVKSGLIKTGRKGVTNKQMIAVFRASKKPSDDTLRQLLSDYPEIFKDSIRYIPDKMKIRLERIIKENGYPEFVASAGKRIRGKQLAGQKEIEKQSVNTASTETTAAAEDVKPENTVEEKTVEVAKQVEQVAAQPTVQEKNPNIIIFSPEGSKAPLDAINDIINGTARSFMGELLKSNLNSLNIILVNGRMAI